MPIKLPVHTTPDQSTESDTPVPKRWSPPGAVGIAILLYVMAQVIAGIIIAIYPRTQNWTQSRATAWVNGAYVQFGYVVLAEALTMLGLLWFMRRRHITFGDIGWKRFRPMHIVYALAGFAVYFVAYIVLVSIASSAIPDLNVNQQQNVGFNQVQGAGQLIVTFISLVVLPPLVEETLFRGFLFTTFRKHMKLRWAIVLTSVLFAAPHLLEAQSGGLLWIGAIDTFTLSVVLCYLRAETHNLWSSVLVHGLKNGLAFLSLYVITIH